MMRYIFVALIVLFLNATPLSIQAAEGDPCTGGTLNECGEGFYCDVDSTCKQGCTTHEDCEPGFACFEDWRCTSLDEGNCRRDVDCQLLGGDWVCVDQLYCYNPNEEREDGDDPGETVEAVEEMECVDDVDCPDGMACEIITHTCVWLCENNSECPPRYYCAGNLCWPLEEGACRRPEDCLEDEECNEQSQVCVAVEEEAEQNEEEMAEESGPVSCVDDRDCGGEEHCAADHTCRELCRADEDCGELMYCFEAGRCDWYCVPEFEMCPDGYYCRLDEENKGRCERIPTADEDGSESPGEEPETNFCIEDVDCEPFGYCVANECVAYCGHPSDCDQAHGECCINRKCQQCPGDPDLPAEWDEPRDEAEESVVSEQPTDPDPMVEVDQPSDEPAVEGEIPDQPDTTSETDSASDTVDSGYGCPDGYELQGSACVPIPSGSGNKCGQGSPVASLGIFLLGLALVGRLRRRRHGSIPGA